MRRFLSALVLASVFVTTFSATIPATFAQRAVVEKPSKKTATQRGVDTIAAACPINPGTIAAGG